MAEFLIKAIDATHPDPDMDQRGCYKLGDIVEVRPDGSNYGTCECLPTFFIVKVPGMLFGNAKKYMEMQTQDGVDGKHDVVRRRKYHFDWSLIPDGVKSILLSEGVYTIEWSVAKNYMKDKVTGLTE